MTLIFCLTAGAKAQENGSASVWVGDLAAAKKKPKPKPININGCWTGPMNDSLGRMGTVTFRIKQSNAQIVKDTGHNHGSTINAVYQTQGLAMGPISGKISGTSISFTATFVGQCGGKGAATIVNSNEIDGTLDYTNCSKFGLVDPLTYQVAHCK
ncbi:MAG TPA: hypothetical protein VJN94_15790 [Candidatus Binataceae bacterium]|nr:hypothetical protein [Candidatus Binataceae bacterium]